MSIRDDRLLAVHYLPVMRLCLSRLHDHADAEDATQEVFRRAVQHATSLSEDVLPWLIAVAKNVCNDELRRRQRLAGLNVADADPEGSPAGSPESVVVGRIAALELLGRLTPGEQRALVGRMANGTGDAAPTSTARVLLARARAKLKVYLEESQAAFGTIAVYGSEAAHRLRSSAFGRTLFGSGQVAVVLPVVLAITVAIGPGVGAPGVGGTAGDGRPAIALGPSDVGQARHDGASGSGASGPALRTFAAPSLGPTPSALGAPSMALPPPAGGLWWTPPTQQDDYHQVSPTDIELSPNYSSDHTLLMVGGSMQCTVLAPCTQIYRSSDGGANWTLVSSKAATALDLVLPAQSFGAGQFYASGSAGVQMTTNNGLTFATVLPSLDGSAMVPPASSNLDVLFAGQTGLFGVHHDGSSEPLSVYPAGKDLAGTPTLVPTATGYTALVPISPALAAVGTKISIAHCTPTCGVLTPLPMSTTFTLLFTSPNVAADHTVYALGGSQVAVSHDDGYTFTVFAAPQTGKMVAVAGPSGRRLLASDMNTGKLSYSDDDGSTWHLASVPNPALEKAQAITEIRPGRLIASMARRDDYGWFYFVCSTDGAAWTACSPDHG